jgi:hypothetical protein
MFCPANRFGVCLPTVHGKYMLTLRPTAISSLRGTFCPFLVLMLWPIYLTLAGCLFVLMKWNWPIPGYHASSVAASNVPVTPRAQQPYCWG